MLAVIGLWPQPRATWTLVVMGPGSFAGTRERFLTRKQTLTSLPAIHLPAGIRSRSVENINGLRMHVLEAGFETRGRPCVLLLHGFPELAFSWRKVMPQLAAAGYHVIAPDQRGYGRTTGWDSSYD